MLSRTRIVDLLAAAAIVTAFGGLFFGRLMIYPVAKAPGSFLERVAARSEAWDVGHRVMLLGMVAVIPAAIALRRSLRSGPAWLTDLATGMAILGATLGVGQYALDFAMLAAARIESPEARQQFLDAWQNNSFLQWTFYKLPDVGQLGLILFTVPLWRQGPSWRMPAALVTLAAAVALVGPQIVGAIGVRIGLGLLFVGFSAVAWKIAFRPAETVTPVL